MIEDIENVERRKIKSANREIILKIEKYANEGVSIGYENDKIVFVRYALPDEVIKVKIYKETKDYSLAEPIEIIESSPLRIKPVCQYFGMCGGCDYQMLSYENQIELKKSLVIETFKKIGKIDVEITDIIKSQKPFGYRNTETFKVELKKGRKIGFFRKDTRSIIDIERCEIAMDGINKALNDIRNSLERPTHNFKVRTTLSGDTVAHWIKTPLYEDREVYEEIKVFDKRIKFKISKDSFFQVNDYVIPLWLEKIISFLNKDHNEIIIDLYSGIGLITLFVSFYARETTGVEIAKSSVDDANHNIKINNINTNVKFILSSVEEVIDKIGSPDVLIIDPPRRGIDNKSIENIIKILPKKIIYSSCKPSSMARDISILSKYYKIKELVLVDMFPQTHHIELLSLLVRK